MEEKFTNLQNYSFTDEGEKVKIYVEFPERAKGALEDKGALQVDYDFQAFDLKLRPPPQSARSVVRPVLMIHTLETRGFREPGFGHCSAQLLGNNWGELRRFAETNCDLRAFDLKLRPPHTSVES